MKITAIVTAFIAFFLVTWVASRPMTIHDVHAVIRVGAPVVDRQGTRALYTLRKWNEATDKTATWIEMLTLSNGEIKRLTEPIEGVTDFSPQFSWDGQKVYFLSTRDASTVGVQIFGTASDGSDSGPTRLTQFPAIGMGNLKVHQDFLLVSMEVFLDCKGDLQCTKTRNDEVEARGPNSWKVYDELFVRHWDKWETGKVSHLFLLRIDQLGDMNALPRDVMIDLNVNAPVPPFGGEEQFDISPDGKEIVFTAELITRERSWTTGWKIFVVSTVEGSSPKLITDYTEARTQDPQYSPDGKHLAFLSMDKKLMESDRLHLEVIERSTGNRKSITHDWDRSIGGYAWTQQDNIILANAEDHGMHKIFSIDLSNNKVKELIKDGHNVGLVPIPNGGGKVVMARDTLASPADIFTFDFTSNDIKLTQLTRYNEEILKDITMSKYERFYFTGVEGEQVQGWLVLPYGKDKSDQSEKKYPLSYLIHGGPESAWSDSWSYRWNPQLWAARGYATVMVNPPGSAGFGRKFTEKVLGNWGGVPYQDLMKGVDHVLAQNPWIEDNACACGGSYGGYMVNWINVKNEKKFKCLVCHNGVFDLLSMYYSTEELWFNQAEFKGLPWEVPHEYDKWNPIHLAGNMNTPQLTIHSNMDFRIPLAQGLAPFTALQRRGIDSRFLYFDLENHWVLNSKNSIKWYSEVLGWMDKYTGNKPPQDYPTMDE